ncbi:hypothetical protein [Mycolicibacterium pyrenivorans]|uniref:hypothetical protein n=1 Tax=Mycolicibacterium pyrenivorans TaxID=187102 RepID=UPI0021F3AF97|nr:hypothetical protein [Mycolicibacterium pyrenivorans]MCV7150527.1 hypothetical protein [Mycolicibacterium pyrenivorans]
MNRRARRQHGRPSLTPAEIQRVAACPDCGSEVESIQVEPGVYEVLVRHDDSCPWLAAFERDGGWGVRFR